MTLNISFDPRVPRLGVGAGPADGSRMCAMQVISWESGDTTITDMPECADPLLARIVQRVNDAICTHRDGDLFCPECSIKVLELAHRTVGTGTLPLSGLQRRVAWVQVAADQARSVLHLARDRAAAERAIVAAERWAEKPSKAAAYAAHAAYAVYAAYAASAAAHAAASAAAYAAASAAAYAAASADASADVYAAYAAAAAAALLRGAHRAIDVFERHTGYHADQIDATVVSAAAAEMCTVTA